MKWIKRGVVFDPRAHRLPDGCTEFAQSPQALVLEDGIRVYFSTRQRDATGKFLSRVCFADFDRSMQTVLRVSPEPVISLGGLGCYDEHGIFPMNVVRHDGEIHAFISGWTRRISVSVDTGIGVARSHDEGLTFHRDGPGPVLTASVHEPFLVGDPFVSVRGGVWHMWYIFGTRWLHGAAGPDEAERVYKIAHATSPDGRTWRRDGHAIIADRLGADECQALPTVFEFAGRHHMYFCYRHATDFRTNPARGYRLGYAWSDDLEHWTRDDANAGIDVSSSGWDAEMQCYPHAFACDGRIFLLYNGNNFGRHGFGVAELDI